MHFHEIGRGPKTPHSYHAPNKTQQVVGAPVQSRSICYAQRESQVRKREKKKKYLKTENHHEPQTYLLGVDVLVLRDP